MDFISRVYRSSLFRKSFVYVFCDGINRAIPFLLLPFITHYLTPSDYGVVTNFSVYMSIMAVFCYSCTIGAVPVMFVKLDRESMKKYVSSVVLLNTIAQLICGVVSIVINGFVYKALNISPAFQCLAFIGVWFAGITFINMVLWRCEEKPLSFGIYQISQSALNAVSTVIFVIVLLLGWKGRIYSMMLATISFGILSIFVLIRRGYLSLSIDKRYMKQVMFFALPLVPHALSFWFKGGVDKILLTNMVGLSSNGLYSVALTWGSVVAMFLTAFNNSYAPYLYQHLAKFDKDKEGTIHEQRKMVKLIWGIIALTGVFIAVMYFVSHLLIKVMYAPIYHSSVVYLPWVMLAQFFQGVYLMFVCFAHYTFNTKGLGIITFTCSLVQVGVTYLMIYYMGPIGAAVSSALTGFAICVLVARFGMKKYSLPWTYFFRNILKKR